jgi:hypothetical protein
MATWSPKADRTFVARIVALERAFNSVDGNPAWWVTLSTGARIRTQTNAACAFHLGNSDFRDVDLTIVLNTSGRIAEVKKP